MTPVTVSLLTLLAMVVLYYEWRIKKLMELMTVYENLAVVVRKVMEKRETKP